MIALALGVVAFAVGSLDEDSHLGLGARKTHQHSALAPEACLRSADGALDIRELLQRPPLAHPEAEQRLGDRFENTRQLRE